MQDPVLDPPPLREEALRGEKSYSDRVLGYAVLASIVVNFGWMAWVAHSNLFGSSSSLIPLKETKIKVFHPIPQKPKPKPPKPLPPPPPPKQQPHVKPPPPLHLQPPRPHPPVPTHQFKVATTKSPTATTKFVMPSAPDTPPPTQPTMPTNSGPDVVAPPPPVETPPAPEVVAPPVVAPPAPKHVDAPPPPPPPVVVHREGWTPIDEQEAEPQGDWPTPQIPSDVDSSTLTSSTVVVSFEVDEKGRATNIKVRQKSGNTEVDDACADAVRSMRFKPAIQDHYFQSAHLTHEFPLG